MFSLDGFQFAMRRERSTVCFDFINAKVRGMRSKLFESHRLRSLAECRTLPDLFRRVYPSRGFTNHLDFERLLLSDHIRHLDKVSRYLSGRVSDLFQWLMVRYQLENLKVVVRVFMSKENRAGADALMAPVPHWLSLPTDKLLGSLSLADFALSLDVPEFREALLAVVEETRQPDLFALEMALDRAYFKKLAWLTRRMKGWTRRLVSFDVDSHGLLLLLRARFNYDRSFDDIKPFLTLTRDYFSERIAEQIHGGDNLSEATNTIPKSFLPPDLRGGLASLVQIEDALLLRQYQLGVRCYAESVLDVAVVLGYYYIKRVEFANLIRLTESVRHSLPREQVVERLFLLSR